MVKLTHSLTSPSTHPLNQFRFNPTQKCPQTRLYFVFTVKLASCPIVQLHYYITKSILNDGLYRTNGPREWLVTWCPRSTRRSKLPFKTAPIGQVGVPHWEYERLMVLKGCGFLTVHAIQLWSNHEFVTGWRFGIYSLDLMLAIVTMESPVKWTIPPWHWDKDSGICIHENSYAGGTGRVSGRGGQARCLGLLLAIVPWSHWDKDSGNVSIRIPTLFVRGELMGAGVRLWWHGSSLVYHHVFVWSRFEYLHSAVLYLEYCWVRSRIAYTRSCYIVLHTSVEL